MGGSSRGSDGESCQVNGTCQCQLFGLGGCRVKQGELGLRGPQGGKPAAAPSACKAPTSTSRAPNAASAGAAGRRRPPPPSLHRRELNGMECAAALAQTAGSKDGAVRRRRRRRQVSASSRREERAVQIAGARILRAIHRAARPAGAKPQPLARAHPRAEPSRPKDSGCRTCRPWSRV